MSRAWNGADLVDELSALLGDTSSAFEARVLGWINDIQKDICTRHDWDFLRFKGKKVLTASAEEQSLIISPPTAATIAVDVGGDLTEDSDYTVTITFVEGVSGIETQAGTESESVTATSVNKMIGADIPVSTDPLVTKRNIYLTKDSGATYFYSTVSDNTTTWTEITADTSSTVEPPDQDYIRKLYGNPFIETTTERQLVHRPIDQLRLLFSGQFSDGTPEFWAPINEKRVLLYKRPSTALTLSFYYYRTPGDVYNVSTSQPTIPEWLKPVLKAGVIAMGYEYRDREGQEGKLNNYASAFNNYVSRAGSVVSMPLRVRDTQGNSDGQEV